MRILMVLPYGPSLMRVRSRMLLSELSRFHELDMLGLVWSTQDHEAFNEWADRGVQVRVVRHGLRSRSAAFLGDPRRPLQQIASTSQAFARAVRELIASASLAGRPYDAVHVEHLRGASAVGMARGLGIRTVFDAVDCIAELARLTKAANPSRVVRSLARYEENRTRRLEASLVRAADITTVVAERERDALIKGGAPPSIEVIPNGVVAQDKPVDLTADPVAIFTGKLSYHANLAALNLLLTDIWPRVYDEKPDARLIVAGADPPQWLRGYSGTAGVQVIANPPAMDPLIRDARVSLAPIVYSVGIQNKVLEALACGVPVVTTASACEGFGAARVPGTLSAATPSDFAALTVRMMEDRALASETGADGHAYVSRHHSWSSAATRFVELYRAPRRETKATD